MAVEPKAEQAPPMSRDPTGFYRETSRGLYWNPTYISREQAYPHRYTPQSSRIRSSNWDAWEDPFRMFYREYVRIQAKKEMSYHSIADSNQRFDVAKRIDRRWVEGMKLYMTALSNTENFTANLMLRMARFVPSPSFSQASLYQAIDEVRHGQNDVNYMRWLNRHYDGLDDWMEWFQRHWMFQTARVGFENMFAGDPFEMVIAVNTVFEAGWTNLLFVANPAVAVANGDIMFGQHQLTTQTDETRHIAIGMVGVRMMLEADERNIPVVQEWFDKWSWLMHRMVGGATSIFIDYFGKNKVMSYKEAFQHYYMKNYIEGLIEDLGPLGLRPPRFLKNMLEDNEIYSHALWKNMYEGRHVNIHKVEAPDRREREWFAEKYPNFKNRYEPFWEAAESGESLKLDTTFIHCKVCQAPAIFTDALNRPTVCSESYGGRRHYFCSEPCKWIFGLEPEKYTNVHTQDEMLAQGMIGADRLKQFWAVGDAQNGDLQREKEV